MFCISYRMPFVVIVVWGTDRFPGRTLADRKKRKIRGITVPGRGGGTRKFQDQILCQNGHGREHVRGDQQL